MINYKFLCTIVTIFLTANSSFATTNSMELIPMIENSSLEIALFFIFLSAITFLAFCSYVPSLNTTKVQNKTTYKNREYQSQVISKKRTSTLTHNSQTIPIQQRAKTPEFDVKTELNRATKNSFDCFLISNEKEQEKNTDAENFENKIDFASSIFLQKPDSIKKKEPHTVQEVKKHIPEQTKPMNVSTNPIQEKKKQTLPKLNTNLLKAEMEEKRKKEYEIQLEKETKNNQQLIRREEIISVVNITNTKGFYLSAIENDKMFLYGFVNSRKFLLCEFSDLTQINLQARFYQKNGHNDVFIVRLDAYKAMIEISEYEMKELAKI